MKNMMSKLVPFALVLALLVSCSAFGMAEMADGAEEAAKLLEDVKGTYEPLHRGAGGGSRSPDG